MSPGGELGSARW